METPRKHPLPTFDYPEVGAVELPLSNEAPLYRREHSRNLDQRERLRALEDLRELGVLKEFSDTSSHNYHGRFAKSHEATNVFKVDPHFVENNRNVNPRQSFYVGEHPLAVRFADARARDKFAQGMFGKTKVYRVDPLKGDTNIFSHEGYEELAHRFPDNRFIQARFENAMSALLTDVSEVADIPLEYSDRAREIRTGIDRLTAALSQSDSHYLGDSEVAQFAHSSGVDYDTAKRIVTAINTKQRLIENPSTMIKYFARYKHDSDPIVHLPNGGSANMDMVGAFLEKANILGEEKRVNSATLGYESVKIISIFDVGNIQNSARIKEERHHESEKVGRLLDKTATFTTMLPSRLSDTLSQPYQKGYRLIDGLTHEIPQLKNEFESDAGVWEGYSLREHTLAVLRNFNNNFADTTPVELLPMMNFGLMLHDIGKPAAVRAGKKHDQTRYNVAAANQILSGLGVDKQTSVFMTSLFMVAPSLAKDAFIGNRRKDPETRRTLKLAAQQRLRQYAEDSMTLYLGEPATPEETDKFIDLARTVMTCDGGAYTSRAMTKRGRVWFQNPGAFDSSFKPRRGLMKKDLRLRTD